MSGESGQLAGASVRTSFLPYGQQWLDEQDIEAVVKVLCSDFITQGPAIDRKSVV